jgi:hypothetical protein
MGDARMGSTDDLQDEGAAKSFMENLMAQVRGLLEEDEPDGYETTAPNWPFGSRTRPDEPGPPTR